MPRAVRVTGVGASNSRFNVPTGVLTSAQPESIPNLGPSPLSQIFSGIAGTAQSLANSKLRRDALTERQQAKTSEEQYQRASAEIIELQRLAVDDPSQMARLDDALAAYSKDPALSPAHQNQFAKARIGVADYNKTQEKARADAEADAVLARMNRAITNIEPVFENDPAIRQDLESLSNEDQLAYIHDLILSDLQKSMPADVYDSMLNDPEAYDVVLKSRNKIFNAHKAEIAKVREEERQVLVKDSIHGLTLDTMDGKVSWDDSIQIMRQRDPSLTGAQAQEQLLTAFKDKLQDVMADSTPLSEKASEYRRLSTLASQLPQEARSEAFSALSDAAGSGAIDAASSVTQRLSANLRGYYEVNDAGVSMADREWANRARGFGLEIPDNIPFNSISPPSGPEGEYLKVLQTAYARQRVEAERQTREKAQATTSFDAMRQILTKGVTNPSVTAEAADASPLYRITSDQVDQTRLLSEFLPYMHLLTEEQRQEIKDYSAHAAVAGVDANDPDFPAETLGIIHSEVFKSVVGGPNQIAKTLNQALSVNAEWGSRTATGIIRSIGNPRSLGFETVIAQADLTPADKYAVTHLALEESGVVSVAPEQTAGDRLRRYREEFNRIDEFLASPQNGYSSRLQSPDYIKQVAATVDIDKDDLVFDNNTAFWMNTVLARVVSTSDGLNPKQQVEKTLDWMASSGYYLRAEPNGRVSMYHDPYQVVPSSYSDKDGMKRYLDNFAYAFDITEQLGIEAYTPREAIQKALEQSDIALPGITDLMEEVKIYMDAEDPVSQIYIQRGLGVPMFAEFTDEDGVYQRIALKNKEGGPLLYRQRNISNQFTLRPDELTGPTYGWDTTANLLRESRKK